MKIYSFGRSNRSGGALLGLSLAFLALVGCATGPDPEVVQARDAVQAARNDPLVQAHAPVALREAEQALVDARLAEARARAEVARQNAEDVQSSVDALRSEARGDGAGDAPPPLVTQ